MNIDIAIVAIYLIATLAIGIWRGRGIKSLKEYAVSDRKYTTPMLVATIAATWYGSSSSIGVAEKVFILGISFTLLGCLNSVAKVFIGIYIAPKFKYFKNAISVGDIMEDLFGRKAKIVTGIAGTFLSMGYVGAQIGGLGYILNYFFGIPSFIGIITGASIVITYSAFGGIKSVVATDILQFFCIIVIIPLMATIAVQQAGGISNIIEVVDSNKLSIFPPNIPKFDFYFAVIVFIIPFLNPAISKRNPRSKLRGI